MKRNSFYSIVVLTLMIVLITGCWDKVEIDDQMFVIGLGIDKFNYEEYMKSHPDEEKPLNNSAENRYVLTYATPNLPVVTNQGGQGASKFVKSIVDATLFSSARMLASRSNKHLNFDHTKAIIFGKGITEDKDLFKEALDSLDRNSNFTRRIPLVIAEDTAQKILNIEPEGQGAIGLYISELFSNNGKKVSRFNPTDLGNVLMQLSETKGNALIPRIVGGKTDIKVAGAVVIKDYQFKGWLGEKEVRGITWIRGELAGGEISIPYDNFYIPYAISNVSTNATIEKKEDKFTMQIHIATEGDMMEYTLAPIKILYDDLLIKDIEKEFEAQIKKEVLGTIQKLQDEFEVEVIGLSKYIKVNNRKIWLEIKDNYDEVFKNMDFSIDVDVNIRRIGITK